MTDRKGRFLFATWDGGGSLAPMLRLAQRLDERGHTVRVLSDPASRVDVAPTGLGFETWKQMPAAAGRASADVAFRGGEQSSPLKEIRMFSDNLVYGPAAATAADVIASVAENPVDAIVADQFLSGAVLAAEALDVPIAIVVPNLDTRPWPGRPPFGPGFQPMAGPIGRLRDGLVARVTDRMVQRFGLAPLNEARAAHGLDQLSSVWEQWDRAARVIVLAAPGFDWVEPRRANTVHVGPVLDDPVWSASTHAPIADLGFHRDRPLVLVSLGTTRQKQRDVYGRIIEALGSLPVNGVVTLGGVGEPSEFKAADNIRVVDSLPHDPLLAGAALSIVHCGHGSTMRALLAGVPMVCIPQGRDQNDNAARVTGRGAGVRLSPNASAAKIAAAVSKLLDDPSYGRAAADLGATIAAEMRPEVAIAEIERLLAANATARAT